MNWQKFIFLSIVFVVVMGLALVAMMLFSSATLRQRLSAFRGKPASQGSAAISTGNSAGSGAWIERAAQVAQPLTRMSLPAEGWERSPMRTRFMNAGWRNRASATLYFAAKTLLALLLPALLAVVRASAPAIMASNTFLFLLFTCAMLGYYLPNMVLERLAQRRQLEIFENFPDALDLLTVCVEAGLSLERALVKVADEIHIKSATLAEELQLLLLEMRAGFTKDKALRNLALRSGVEDVDSLVAMMIQSERFGTSMGDSLRVHADNLRTKRSQLAEEKAAKIALKLLFPLIFCIFPILLLVLLGPAILQIIRVLLPTMASGSQ